MIVLTLVWFLLKDTLEAYFHAADAIALLRVLLTLRLELVDETDVRVKLHQGYLGLQQHVDHYHQHLVGVEHQLLWLDVGHLREHLLVVDIYLLARLRTEHLLQLLKSLIPILMRHSHHLLVLRLGIVVVNLSNERL